MVRTRVGYTGGMKADPTYHSLGDHTEAIQIDYDPAQLSYRQLVELFFTLHSPVRPAFSRQYRSAIWYGSPEEEAIARDVLAAEERRLGTRLATDIESVGMFTRAEDYHQKYYLKMHGPLAGELRRKFGSEDAFTDSTAVARINGFVGGSGDKAKLDAELSAYGLSERGAAELKKLAANASGIHCAY